MPRPLLGASVAVAGTAFGLRGSAIDRPLVQAHVVPCLRYVVDVVDDDAILAAGRTLAAEASSPAEVVLFGSRARGAGRVDSDLDFLVIEDRVENKLHEMVRLRDALPPLGVAVDVVVVSREEATRRAGRRGTLVHRALAEGRVLVAR